MKLCDLLAGIEVAKIAGGEDMDISGLAYDSQRVGPGALRMVFRVLAAIAAALALSGLLLFGPCVSHWFCV